MNQGFFIAKKKPDGSPGIPIGNEDEAISMFDDLEKAVKVKDEMEAIHGKLSIFRVSIVHMGEVIIP